MWRNLLWLNAAVTFVLVGLIWTVQVVHYPLFAQVGQAEWPRFHAAHVERITWLVAPLMLAEAMLTAALFFPPSPVARSTAFALAAPVIGAWCATMWVAVPLHHSLDAGIDRTAIASLVSINWIRTVAWTARGAGLMWMLWSPPTP
jgi:hypothetical protein